MQKYGFDDARPILERASARETAARVALGAVAARFLGAGVGIRLVSHTVSIGPVAVAEDAPLPTPDDVDALDADPVRCFDPETSAAMVAEVDAAHKDGDTLGGVVEVLAYGLPPGLGSHVHWDRRLDARLAGALMGIQAIKGVEVGDGFRTARRRGSRRPRRDGARDRRTASGAAPTAPAAPRAACPPATVLRVRAAMKPISTVPHALRDRRRRHRRAGHGAPPALRRLRGARRRRRRRGDGRARARRGVLEKFGGDSVAETAATSRPTSPRSPSARCAPGDQEPSARVVLVGPPGCGQDAPWARRWPTPAGRAAARHRRRHRGARRRRRSPTSSSRTASRASGRSSAPRSPGRSPRSEGVLALGGGAPVDPATRGRARRADRGRSSTSALADAVAARSASTRAGRCSRQPACLVAGA